jgi:hypothetical protein
VPLLFKNAERVITIPLPEAADLSKTTPKEVCLINRQRLIDITVNNKIEKSSISMIIIETNYNFPSNDIFAQEIFDYALHEFETAKIVAYGSTMGSMVKALQYHERINAFNPVASSKEDSIRRILEENGDLLSSSMLTLRVYDYALLKDQEKTFVLPNSQAAPDAFILNQNKLDGQEESNKQKAIVTATDYTQTKKRKKTSHN